MSESGVTAPAMDAPIVAAKGLTKRFDVDKTAVERLAALFGQGLDRAVLAVDDVDLSIAKSEVLALVGESGCGKSTLGRMVAGLLTPSSGSVYLDGKDRHTLTAAELKRARLAVQMIFQDPMSSLNPRLPASKAIGEGPRVHRLVERAALEDYVKEMMELVGLNPGFARRYPHQLSGGQRQRLGIARALAVQPRVLVCDESVAALDVSIQAQILNLFMRLRTDLGLTYLFISHDLSVVEHISDRTMIMYLGRVIESASTAEIFARPNHPYAKALLAEAPRIDTHRRHFEPIRGEIPSPMATPAGCAFHPRCPVALARCRTERPVLRTIAPGHSSACHLNDLS